MDRKRHVISAEAMVIEQQFERNGGEMIIGSASFLSPHELAIDFERDGVPVRSTVQTDFVVIATGSSPDHPAAMDFNTTTIFDSDSILNISTLPRSLAVVGAGVIGCEYASIFARMGSKVTLINKPPGMLRGVDNEIVEAIRSHFTQNRILLRLGCEFNTIETITKADGTEGVAIVLAGKQHVFDALLYCVGRRGNVEGLNLAAAGLAADERGLMQVNELYQTKAPHIYAVGDIIGAPSLAASSAEQGRLASAHAFGLRGGKFPNSFPFGIYTIPEISWAGKKEEDLEKEKIPYVVGRARYKEMARGRILGDEHGFLKLLVHRDTGKLLGIHILGTGATELIHIGQVVMDLGGDIEFLVSNVFNYPTLAEAYKVAAYAAHNQLRAAASAAAEPVAQPALRRAA